MANHVLGVDSVVVANADSCGVCGSSRYRRVRSRSPFRGSAFFCGHLRPFGRVLGDSLPVSSVSPPACWLGQRFVCAAFRYWLYVLLYVHGGEPLVWEIGRRRIAMDSLADVSDAMAPARVTDEENMAMEEEISPTISWNDA